MFAPAAWILYGSLCALPQIEPGAQFTYLGQMLAVKGEAADTRKTFELSLLVREAGDRGAVLAWSLEERGRGGFAWPDRVGRWQLDGRGRPVADTGPALLYDRGDGLSVVPLHTLLLAAESPLAKGLAWSEGKLEYLVAGEEQAAGTTCWRVEVRNQYGPKRVLWVEKGSALVAALTETVFIGQGQQFDMRIELASRKQLEPARLDATLAASDLLLNLREKLGRAPRTERGEWSDEQLKTLRAAVTNEIRLPAELALASVYRAALADVNNQRERAAAVAALRGKLLGAEIGNFSLEDLSGKAVSAEELKGRVTVLHFWEYKDAPLEEPYGQTGYLDFLYRQRKGAGLQVYGVAVDERLADPEKRRAAVSGVKKFQSFMNLSYPLLADSGAALKQLGDPRPAGGKLPVFVVLDAQGKVLLYQAGFFEVKRDRGLEELDAAVTKALDEAKGK